MFLELYQVEDNHNTINKEKTLIDTMNITFKRKTNILTPVIKIKYDGGVEMFNYAYIDELARYYFITNIEPYPNNIYYLHLEVDVLETYKEDILSSRKVEFKQKVKPVTSIVESVGGAEPETSYILTTVAKTGDVEDIEIEIIE